MKKNRGGWRMKFLHTADLHIGKRLNEFNLIADQAYILEQIIHIARKEEVDGVLLAGDIYDKTQPSAEAVELLDEFLTKLTSLDINVFMISGNHDSAERLSFGHRIMEKTGLYISGRFAGSLEPITIADEHGWLNVYLLPFIKPAQVRPYFAEPIETYHQAIEAILKNVEINQQERNILIAHQFVICGSLEPERSDSENISVGGLDSVDISLFAPFDYVALGHLHRPQKMGTETVRYAGSPLKYSFSEALHEKSVTILDFGAKGELDLKEVPLLPLRNLREIKGPLAEILRIGREDDEESLDYVRITLTDEEEIYDAIGQLRQVYPNLMVLDFENRRTAEVHFSNTAPTADLAKQSPLDLFASFYELQNNSKLNEEQIKVLTKVFTELEGGEV